MQRYFWLVLLFFVSIEQFSAQQDTIHVKKIPKESLLKKALIPTTFILSGMILNKTQTEKNWQRDIRNKVGNDYGNSIDDYLQYVPHVQVYIGDIVGIRAKNHWFDQTKNIFISSLLTGVVIQSFKRGIGKERPDASNSHSFPSGHTATAFTGATVLYYEYKDSSPAYAYSGYLFATATGSLRVMNNKHWVSDVLTGAGVGMLVTALVYHIEPIKNWNPFKKTENLTFSPIINGDDITFVAALKF